MKRTLEQLNFGIVGLGRVGTVFARQMNLAGLKISAIHDISRESVDHILAVLGENSCCKSGSALKSADIVLFCVPDDIIATVTRDLVARNWLSENSILVHTSGLHSPSIFLSELPGWNCSGVATCHPCMAFPSKPDTAVNFKGVGFGITAGPDLARLLESFVRKLQGIPVAVPVEKRPYYHLAAVLTSNFSVLLEMIAMNIMEDQGFSKTDAAALLNGLMASVVENLRRDMPENVVSGPVVRKDWDTVRQHRNLLENNFPEYTTVYKLLSELLAHQYHSLELPWSPKSDTVTGD